MRVKQTAKGKWTAPQLLDSMIYWKTIGVIFYVNGNTKQKIYGRV